MKDGSSAGATVAITAPPCWETCSIFARCSCSKHRTFCQGEKRWQLYCGSSRKSSDREENHKKGADALLSRAATLIYMRVSIPAAVQTSYCSPTYCGLCIKGCFEASQLIRWRHQCNASSLWNTAVLLWTFQSLGSRCPLWCPRGNPYK